ncbi:TetR/AcrR family transcriptional regulator [Streptomyces sp. NPDC018036]|uniref:TetR/AcrR family transcriptional regulator n=1 Tax=Streptomyces sp. NPDC018036 TaxID=3365035 RepID=UPI003792942D
MHPDKDASAGSGAPARPDGPLRSDARRNRERILAVALAELTRSADTPLSAIARKAGVGQGTFYRNFHHREALIVEIHRHEVRQVTEAAAHLLATRPPHRALREWTDRLTRFAMAEAGLTAALRTAEGGSRGVRARLDHGPVRAAVALLLRTNEQAGTIRPGVTPDDFLLAVAGLWHLDPHGDWPTDARRLLDLVTDGLRVGAPGPATPSRED